MDTYPRPKGIHHPPKRGPKKREEKSSKCWKKPDTVDRRPGTYRRRKATRDVVVGWPQWYMKMRDWTAKQFLAGKGLTRTPRDKSTRHYALYVQDSDTGEEVLKGYTDDVDYAIGWQRGAEWNGLRVRCYQRASK
jgi:hypothetical protein